MDGVHDLGGVQGFGPIKTDDDERPFKAAWEGRVWGINAAISGGRGWTIDWWRFTRELIEPLDYLQRPYFDQWAQTYAALLIDSGMATVEEVASGRAESAGVPSTPPLEAEEVRRSVRRRVSYARDGGLSPRHGVGDHVTARSNGSLGHTRLPRYVRGRSGVIHQSHGAHVFPDDSARGVERAEPLYTVRFAARELWPEGTGRDFVYVDLWESYLEH
jgi:nitrile hydratase